MRSRGKEKKQYRTDDYILESFCNPTQKKKTKKKVIKSSKDIRMGQGIILIGTPETPTET